ncbi:amidase 1-like isoform X2 [Apium graveolens]|uniref:amidase 1-like isoform X2 n=1 Tax=Apium graveolens TaxID=4045 RepID=UPI003D7997AF
MYGSSRDRWRNTENMAAAVSQCGAFIEKFVLKSPSSSSSSSSSQELPLNGLTFAVKDVFDVEGYVTGFGNPDWARTHSAATSTAPAITALLRAGATCVGKTVLDEMAYGVSGENKHYGTPTNPSAPDRVPGGSSSGSAVAVGAGIVDFSLGTDTGGSVRIPASYCGIFGFRPSHGVIETTGVIPMAQSFDTIGWFARDPVLLNQVGRILLQIPQTDPLRLSRIIIAEDCFNHVSLPSDRTTGVLANSVKKLFGGDVIRKTRLGDYVVQNVPSLKHFRYKVIGNQDYDTESLVSLSYSMRLLVRYQLKNNHGEWVRTVKPDFDLRMSERVQGALTTTEKDIEHCHSVKTEFRDALSALLGDCEILAIPTVPGPPPKLQSEALVSSKSFRNRSYFSFLSVAALSGFCQVSIPLGNHDGLPVSVSLVAKLGSDGFLLNFVESLDETIKEQIEMAEQLISS